MLPGMQAAFVDVGLERAAFLYVADVADERGGEDDSTSTVMDLQMNGYQKPIQELLHEGKR